MSRMSLHQAHIELNNGFVDVAIPFTNELNSCQPQDIPLDTNFRNNSLKDGMFKFTSISEALIYLGKFRNPLRPLL